MSEVSIIFRDTERPCLVNGQHTPGTEWERGCPLRNAAARSERAKRAWDTRRASRPCPGSGVPETAPDSTTRSGGRPKGSATGGRFQRMSG